jgi:hypothetical protein
MSFKEVLVNDRCWFCGRPILGGERANRFPHGCLAVRTACLQQDAINDGARPTGDDLPHAA